MSTPSKTSSNFSLEYVQRLQERVRELEKERREGTHGYVMAYEAHWTDYGQCVCNGSVTQTEVSESERKNKRQRLEIESIAVSKVRKQQLLSG